MGESGTGEEQGEPTSAEGGLKSREISESQEQTGRGTGLAPEQPDHSAQPTPDSLTQSGVLMIDGVPVLQDIVEEEPAEVEVEEMEDDREEIVEQIKLAIEERDRLQSLSSQVQHDIAEYLARKKVEIDTLQILCSYLLSPSFLLPPLLPSILPILLSSLPSSHSSLLPFFLPPSSCYRLFQDDEKADPGRTVVDHEKKYFQCMGEQ